MKKINYLIFPLFLVWCASGCVTATVSSRPQIEELQSQVNSLQMELDKEKSENILLRQQVAALVGKKEEVRMPTAKEIQAALKKSGFYQGEVDGQIGAKTKDALKKFQEANKINPDGVVGSRTWILLQKYLEEKKE